jgi:hypothetical protein
MSLCRRMSYLTGMTILLMNGAAAQAQTASFIGIDDAVPGRFFDAATTAPVGNTLIIRFNTGRDPATWKDNDFRASTAAFSHQSAMDTIHFTIVAPENHRIFRVTYNQRGTGSVVRTGKAAGGSTWVVGGVAGDVGIFGTNPTVSATMELPGEWTEVPVSITTGLHVFSTPQLGSATVTLTQAEVVVELRPLPAPLAE